MSADYVVGRIGGWVVWHGDQAAEIERLRLALARRGGLADYYHWRLPLLVRGRGIYSGWGLETGLLRAGDE